MSEFTYEFDDKSTTGSDHQTQNTWGVQEWLWALPQPILVLGTTVLMAFMVSSEWVHSELFAAAMIVVPIPVMIVAERIWTKRTDWLLEPKEMIEDAGWLAAAGLLFIPLYSDFYQTPISEGFKAIRDLSPLGLSLDPTSVAGLLGSALVVMLISTFVYYWLHRIQHETLFWWRMHATHHHITNCLLYTSPSPRDVEESRMPSSA